MELYGFSHLISFFVPLLDLLGLLVLLYKFARICWEFAGDLLGLLLAFLGAFFLVKKCPHNTCEALAKVESNYWDDKKVEFHCLNFKKILKN